MTGRPPPRHGRARIRPARPGRVGRRAPPRPARAAVRNRPAATRPPVRSALVPASTAVPGAARAVHRPVPAGREAPRPGRRAVPGEPGMTVTASGTPPVEPYDVAVVGAGVVGCAIARRLAQHPGSGWPSWRRGTTSGRARPRPTPPSCTPGCNAGAGLAGGPAGPRGIPRTRRVRRRVGHPRRTRRRPARRLGRGTARRPAPARREGPAQRVPRHRRPRPRRPLRPRTPPRPRRARRPARPRREHHLPVDDHHPGVRHPGRPRRESTCTSTHRSPTQDTRTGVCTSVEHAALLRRARPVPVNAAGLHADTLDRHLGHEDFTVTPRRGQLVVHDKFARALGARHILLPVPTALGKGVLVAPTITATSCSAPPPRTWTTSTTPAPPPKG
ncbi:hypothetical protein STENM223S_05578 [Streptomyces tendae]